MCQNKDVNHQVRVSEAVKGDNGNEGRTICSRRRYDRMEKAQGARLLKAAWN